MNDAYTNHFALKITISWITVFTLLSGAYWISIYGLIFMTLAVIGIIHLIIIIYDEIYAPKFYHKMTPREFEYYCAEILTQYKWTAHVTQASHDQGIDIIAEKRGLRIIIQCKKYNKPVGNFAVQEVTAALAYKNADRGIVVATSGFTKAAIELAECNNVLLLDYRDLCNIDKLLRQPQNLYL